jgi:hypothetical protein
MGKIKVLAKKVGEELKLVEFEHSYDNMCKIVEGRLEVVGLPLDIDMWLNEEGLLEQKNVNVITFLSGRQVHQIVGNIFFAGHDEEGETISLTDEQMEWLKKFTVDCGYAKYNDGREQNRIHAIICD